MKVNVDVEVFSKDDLERVEENIISKVSDRILKKLSKQIEDRIKTILDEQVRALAAEKISEVLTDPIQKTNPYGEPIGDPITFNAFVREQFQKKDSYNNRLPMLDQAVETHLKAALKTEFAPLIAKAKKQISDGIESRVFADLRAHLLKQLNLRP